MDTVRFKFGDSLYVPLSEITKYEKYSWDPRRAIGLAGIVIAGLIGILIIFFVIAIDNSFSL